jgi:hypothetical protein
MKIACLFAGALLSSTALSAALAADMNVLPVKAPPPRETPFFIVNDTSFSYYHAFTATDPGVNKTQKDVLEITHFDVWKYGTNFFDIQGLQSDNKDPTRPCVTGQGCMGAVEVYGLFRSTLGFNEIAGTKMFSAGPLTDVSLEFGADANTENNPFAPAKKDVVAGLQFAFALPYKGFFNVSPMIYQEWNHEGLFPILGAPGSYPAGLGNSVQFKPTWDVEFVYSQPLGFLPIPLKINGFTDIHGPKGQDGFGSETKTEVLSETHLTLDAGQVFAGKPNWIDLWAGYRFWYNKFGADHTVTPFAIESTWLAGITWHAIDDIPVTSASFPVKAKPLPFFIVNDNAVTYYHAFSATDPGVATTAKNVLEYSHFDVWKYGTNFFDIQALQSDNKDPVSPCVTGQDCMGAVEVYTLFRSTLGFNELSGTKMFSFGPLTNVSLEYGGDANTENNPFTPEKKDVVAGLQFGFALPYKGFLNVSPMFYQEWNHEGLFPISSAAPYPAGFGRSVQFQPTYDVEFVFSQPLGFLPVPLKLNGFTNIHGPKGPDGFGTPTKEEILSETHLTLDFGQMVANKPNWIDVWAGYRYWYNKFGADHNLTPFAIESTALAGVTWHAF